MLLNKDMAVYVIVISMSILLSSCASTSPKGGQKPAEATATDTQPLTCGDPLAHYSGLAAQTNEGSSTVDTTALSVEHVPDVCRKLHEAIVLSMPGSVQQNDKEALVLLQGLTRTNMPSDSDLQFKNMLLQHVSQRQDLREKIAAQHKRLVEVEKQNTVLSNQLKTLQLQIDQLKDIEVEIDRKERSLTSPNND